MEQLLTRGEEAPAEPAAGPAPEQLFATVFIRRRSPWKAVGLSAIGHVGAGYFLVAYTAFVAAHPLVKKPDLNTARILELDISKLLPYVPPDIPRVNRPPTQQQAQPTRTPQVQRTVEPQPENPAPANPIPAPRVTRSYTPPLQVADAPKVARAPETLIQLDIPQPELQTQLQVPNAIILTNSPRRFLPRPVIRPPELDKKDVPQAVVDMDLPRIQSTIGDVPIAQALTDHAALPVLPTSKAPLSGTSTKPAEVAAGNWKAEEAPALIALPDNPIPNHTAVVVPPAEQMGSKGADKIQAGAPGQGGGGGTGTSTAQTAQTSPGTQIAANINPGAGIKPAPAPTTPAVPRTPQPAAVPPAPPATAQPRPGPRPSASLPEIARVSLPRDGNYEVVVTQNAGIVPGTADFLLGRPVYSVYLHAGAKLDWILQYCLPAASEPARKNSTVVSLAAPAPLAAPYAFTMLRPALTFAAPDVRYAMIHGVINKDGHFEQLNEVGDRALKNMPELMQALAGWEFRPATKDGVAVAVEVLLCIPNSSS